MEILFFTGKGGVGKSTMAAAAAWQLSQEKRVLIVSLDPVHNLGDIFGVSLKGKKYRFTDTLSLCEVDIQTLSREYLQRNIDILSKTYKYLQTMNLDTYFSALKYSPGIEEHALLTSIEKTIRDETDFDYIVFDTPPTGLTLRFLALPKVTITWVERLIDIRKKILEKRYTIEKIRGKIKDKTSLKYNEEEDDVMKRLRFLNNNYQLLNNVLRSKSCSIILVFNPDILSMKESQRLIEGLTDLNLPLRLFIDNKVTKKNVKMADHVEKIMMSMAEGIPIERVSLLENFLYGIQERLYDISTDIVSKFLVKQT